jgi:hypothetical protein
VELGGGEDEQPHVRRDGEGGEEAQRATQRANVRRAAEGRALGVEKEQVGISADAPDVGKEADEGGEREGGGEEYDVPDLYHQAHVLGDDAREPRLVVKLDQFGLKLVDRHRLHGLVASAHLYHRTQWAHAAMRGGHAWRGEGVHRVRAVATHRAEQTTNEAEEVCAQLACTQTSLEEGARPRLT